MITLAPPDRFFRIILVMFSLLVFSIILTGCVSDPGKIAKNQTPAAQLPIKVSPEPLQQYIKAGQLETFTYWGHAIEFNYSSANPSQKFLVTVDESEKLIQKELTDSPNGIYWNEGNLSFTLKPVVWEMRDGQNVPIYESTWNTTEVYFTVNIIAPTSHVTGGPLR